MILAPIILTSALIQAKADKVKTWYVTTETIEASVTKYGCKQACVTAIGKKPVAGRTIACPKRFAMGVAVSIEGVRYICEDRTADWVQRRNGDTFDIFTNETEKEQRQFGRQKMEVTITHN